MSKLGQNGTMKMRGAKLVAMWAVLVVGLVGGGEAFPWKGMFSNRDGQEARAVRVDDGGGSKAEEVVVMKGEQRAVREEGSDLIGTRSRDVNMMEAGVVEGSGGIGGRRDKARRQRREGDGNGRGSGSGGDVRYATVGSAVYAVKDDDIAVMKGVGRSESRRGERGEAGVARGSEHDVTGMVDAVRQRAAERVSEGVSEVVSSERGGSVEVEAHEAERVDASSAVDEGKKEDSTLAIMKKEVSDMDKTLGPQAEGASGGSEHSAVHGEERTNGWWRAEGKERMREGVLQAMQGLNRLYRALGGSETVDGMGANGSFAEGVQAGGAEVVGGARAERIGLEGNESTRAAAAGSGEKNVGRPVGVVSVVGGVVIVVGLGMLGVSFAQRQGGRGGSNGGGSSGAAALYPPRGPSFV